MQSQQIYQFFAVSSITNTQEKKSGWTQYLSLWIISQEILQAFFFLPSRKQLQFNTEEGSQNSHGTDF